MRQPALEPRQRATGNAPPGEPSTLLTERASDGPSSESHGRSGDAGREAAAKRGPLRPAALLLAAGAFAVLVPLWVPLLLAAWFATLARAPHRALTRRLGNRHRAAAVLTLLLVLGLLAPVAVVALSVAPDADELVRRLSASKGAHDLVTGLVTPGDAPGGGPTSGGLDARRLLALASEHGQRGWATLRSLTSTLADAAIALFVFLFGAYALLADGPRHYRWAVDHAPLARPHAHRLANAFEEAGRGLAVGVGLTALLQGAIGTTAYLALGVPQALLLGLVTCFAAVVPTFGTSLVWVPVAAGLALSGQTAKALVLAGVGVGVVALVDNVLHPVLTRYGKLELPPFVILAAMFGGLAVAGPWGLLLGPLLVRLAKEGLAIAREERAWGRRDDSPAGGGPAA